MGLTKIDENTVKETLTKEIIWSREILENQKAILEDELKKVKDRLELIN